MMLDDLLLPVLLCELGERLLSMREMLTQPSVAAKSQSRAVAAILGRGLDSLEDRIQREVLDAADVFESAASGQQGAALSRSLAVLADCSQAFQALHARLGLLDVRGDVAPVDIFLRKLREDVEATPLDSGHASDGQLPLLPSPTVVLADSYDALDDDVAARLRADLAAVDAGLAANVDPDGAPIIALPRLEAADPLAWPLLLGTLARAYLHQRADRDTTRSLDRDRTPRGVAGPHEFEGAAAVCLGGPAVYAARAVAALLLAPADARVWTPALRQMETVARACAGGLDGSPAEGETRGAEDGIVSTYGPLLSRRDEVLGSGASSRWGDTLMDPSRPWVELGLPRPDVPTATETADLLDKLAAGTPINAIAPPVPRDFVQRLERMDSARDFYDLIAPLGERPASLAAILGVGWLYKVRYSYPLFRDLLRDRRGLRPALELYRPHLLQRNDVLLQSIEAAHVQGIFTRAAEGTRQMGQEGQRPVEIGEEGEGTP